MDREGSVMATAPTHIPGWLMNMQGDVGSIKSSIVSQGREIGELKMGQATLTTEVKGLGKEVSEVVSEKSILEAQVQDHICDDHRHLTKEDVEDEVEDELSKRGLGWKERGGRWISTHPRASTGGLLTLLLALYEAAREVMIR